MDVPLIAQRHIWNGKQYVELYRNGERKLEPAPFAPYYYARGSKEAVLDELARRRATGVLRVTEESCSAMSQLEVGPEQWCKVEVENVEHTRVTQQNEHTAANVRTGWEAKHGTARFIDREIPGIAWDDGEPPEEASTYREHAPMAFAENHIGLIERILADEPDWFRKHANTRPLRVVTFDLEQLTAGDGFPTKDDPLISIAWSCDLEGQPDAPIRQRMLPAGSFDDTPLLKIFLKDIIEFDFDVLQAYNAHKYDVLMLIERMRKIGLPTSLLARRGVPYVSERTNHKGLKEVEVVLPGRIVYDVYRPVELDQTMFGIKDRKLKTVGKWRKLPVIEEDASNLRDLMGTKRLAEYNCNDVRLCRTISKPYFANMVALANKLGAPLNSIIRSTPNFFTTIIHGAVNASASPRVLSDGTTFDRYTHVYQDPVCPVNTTTKKKSPVTGAIIDIYKTGLFRPLFKVDFSSMYPGIYISLGLGPDNTRLVGWEPAGPLRCEVEEDVRRYSIPDHGWGRNFVVEVRGYSRAAEKYGEILNHRLALKAQRQAETDPTRKLLLKAQEDALKVVLNAVYGNNAGSTTRYGSLVIGMTITGIARYLITRTLEALGDIAVETDTDGVYTDADIDVDAANVVLDDCARVLGLRSHVFRVEKDSYKAGYFVKKKQYVLQKENGSFEYHGAAFKSASASAIADKTLSAVTNALFNDSKKAACAAFADALTLNAFQPEDFVQRVRPKHVNGQGNSLGAQVARAFIGANKRAATQGDTIPYVVTRSGYEMPGPEAHRRIDKDHYRDVVRGIGERFGLSPDGREQMTITHFMGGGSTQAAEFEDDDDGDAGENGSNEEEDEAFEEA